MILKLQATPQEVMRAVETLEVLAAAAGVSDTALFGLKLAVEECGSNIVNHAFQRDPLQTFQVSIEHAEGTFTIEFRDGGPEFDPTAAPGGGERDEEAAPGGWGIQLVRRYVDQMRYTRAAGQNILTLVKRISPSSGGTDD